MIALLIGIGIIFLGVKLITFGFRATIGIAKFILPIILIPLAIIGLAISGLIVVALPVLIVIGVIWLIVKLTSS